MGRRIFFLIACAAAICIAQELSEQIEPLLDTEESSHAEPLWEQLDDLARRPLDLNRASAEDLSVLPIPPSAIEKILAYRKKHGAFLSVDDLQKIKGLSSHLPMIRPFVVAKPPSPKITFSGRHRLRRKIGTNDSRVFPESQLYHRCRIVRGKTALGLLVEKDADEQNWNDYTAGHIIWEPVVGMRMIFGDYTVELGCRLVLGGHFSLPLGSDPTAPVSAKRCGVFPYLSTNENFAFRGAAWQYARGAFQLSVFGSEKCRDARLENGRVVSLPSDGLHRTQTEILKRNALRERSEGAALIFKPFANVRFGVLALQNRFSAEFLSDPNENPPRFSGNRNRLASLFGDLVFGDVVLFGETARHFFGGKAWSLGAVGGESDYDWIVLLRRYAPEFFSFYASAFGESSANNQQGFYFGGNYRLSKRMQVSFYYDQYKKISFVQPDGSAGDVLMAGLKTTITSKATFAMQIKLRTRRESIKTTDVFGNTVPAETEEQRSTWRMLMDFRPYRTLRLRSTMETSFASLGSFHLGRGTLLSSRADANFRRLRLALASTFFDAPRWPLRLYQPEPDLTGCMTISLLYGRGVRNLIVVSAKASRFVVSAKYEQTVYRLRTTTTDSVNQKISLQIDWEL